MWYCPRSWQEKNRNDHQQRTKDFAGGRIFLKE
jgi:hypothetical protein